VTDLCRTFRHRLYRWPDHLARFRRSCRLAYIDVPFDDAFITQQAEELVGRNASLVDANQDLALVLFATPGPVGYYLGQPTAVEEQPTFGMHTFPLPFARYRPWIEQGIKLATPSVRQVPRTSVNPHIKQRSRMHWWLAEQEVKHPSPPTPLPQGERGANAQALLLDLHGNITETASSNFLLVKNNSIVSPCPESILDGISLNVVMELCERLRIPFAQRNILLDEGYAADELLLTCTSYCLAGVVQLNGKEIPWPGPMLHRLLEAWNEEVGVDIHGQILNARE
jgi:branched-chain amino acid aminotransferase